MGVRSGTMDLLSETIGGLKEKYITWSEMWMHQYMFVDTTLYNHHKFINRLIYKWGLLLLLHNVAFISGLNWTPFVIMGLSLGWAKSMSMKLVFDASPINMQY